MSYGVMLKLHKKYVKGTEREAVVQLVQVSLCNLTNAVVSGISFPSNKVYISTRVLKHLYDKRPAEEFEFLIKNGYLIVKYPDKIYRNKSGKRGSFCFVKEIRNQKYLCSIEITEKEDAHICEVVTLFRTKDSYIKNYELLWEWKGGDLHRSAFDSDKNQPNSTPQ